MKRLIVIALILLSLFIGYAKAGTNYYWIKSYGGSGSDVIRDVEVLLDESIIAVGYIDLTDGSKDALVMKLSPKGEVMWAKTYGGSGEDYAHAVAVAPNGDIIVAGYTGSFGAGGWDVWILRLDSNGNIKWQKTYGGSDFDGYWDVNVAVASNGDIIVTGVTESFGAGGRDVWVLRLDSNGNVKWQKTYGGSDDDEATAIALAENGDIIVAGVIWSFGAGKSDVWVLRLDANGNIKWQKTYGDKSTDEAFAVAVAPNGDIIVAGYTGSFGAGGWDVWILRLDSNGNIKWQKTYGGSDDDEASAVALAPNGDIIVAGGTESFGVSAGDWSDVWVLRLDENGNIKWQKTYGGFSSDRAFAITVAGNGDIVIAGRTTSFGAGYYDAWVLCIPPDGNLPGCEFCKDSNAQVESSSAEVSIPNAKVIQSKAIVKTSRAEASNPNIIVKTQYEKILEGILKISSEPSGAKVYVNGDYKGTTPLTLELEPGTYTVKLTKEDYEDYTTTINLGADETKDISATLKPAHGYLTVESSPPDAEVYVDENYVGRTPLENYKLSTGSHKIVVKKEGYKEFTETVTIESGRTVKVEASLSSVPAILKISSEPSGAKVYVNGDYKGTTPLTLELEPGTYTVEIKKDGYEAYTEEVTITAGQTTSISASLVAIPTTSSERTPTYSETVTTVTTVGTQTTPVGTGIKTPYIMGGILLLLVLGGVAAKAMGGKSKKKPAPTEVKKPKAEKPKEPETPKEVKKPAIPEPPVPGFPPVLLKAYEPLEFIGEGGFAKVFKAKRRKDGKIVALKIPRIDRKTSKTFIKEVSTWLHLNHPNIVRLYDVDILPIPYLEMEYVEGVKVEGEIIRDLDGYPKPVPEETALRLIRGIAEGLKYAHSKGIYHRDLKPLNILLKSNLTPKITDWGLAKIGTMSSSRSVLGYTPLYAAPEHLMPGKYGHTDARTDIWQLGVTFYELLTGKLPFEGYTYEEVSGKIVDETYKFTPPSKINPELAKYDDIFEKLLAKRKEERYQSVDEFLRDLEKLEEAEKRKVELEKEVEELKKSLSRSMQVLKQSKTTEEIVKNRRMVVETLGKLALAYAELNRKAELLNTLNDLKFYTIQNLNDLMNAINTVEMLIKENLPVGEDFTERLKVLVHSIKRENEMGRDETPTNKKCHDHPYGTIPVEKARHQPGSKIRAIHVCLDGNWYKIEIPGGHWSQTLRTLAEFLIDKGIQDIQVDGFIERSSERLVRDQNGDWVKGWYVYPPYPHEAINKLRELQIKLRQRYPNRKIKFALEVSQPKSYG